MDIERLWKNMELFKACPERETASDNALAESFFGILKTELLYKQSFETAEEFITSLKEYIHLL
ncbi:IS3 family transposase [Mucilaginibacter paludis]|uniref:IS3 family transposase n=1 Tax=Mucilaginibacter paludis TaxID=423351 RepID=UPI0009FD9479